VHQELARPERVRTITVTASVVDFVASLVTTDDCAAAEKPSPPNSFLISIEKNFFSLM